MSNASKKSVLSSLIWKMMEQAGSQIVQLIIQIILARLLMPDEYGIIALITIFINIANVFVQSGLNIALIQKKDADELDFSSVFYFSLFIAGFLYILLFITAPTIASFYNEEQLILIIRVISISLFLGALNSVQNTVIMKQMAFKNQFLATLCGNIVYGIVGVLMAYFKFGVWALVFSQLSSAICINFILWFTIRWRPKLIFSLNRLKGLFSFGWKMLCSSIVSILSDNIYGLIIGKVYNSETLGYYNRGNKFPSIIATTINSAVSSVILPVLSRNQDDTQHIKLIVRRSVKSSSFIILPIMTGLFIIAEFLVKIILTEKWLPCVPFIRLICIEYAFASIQTANKQAYASVGRSDVILKIEMIKNVFTIIALLIGLPFGIYFIVSLKAFVAILMLFINAYYSKKLIGYKFSEQCMDIYPNLTVSLMMGVIINSIKYLPYNSSIILILEILIGIVVYIGLSFILKNESFKYLVGKLRTVTFN